MMRIRRQILHFLHEKVFRHDRGREPNKFTYFIYRTLFPFKKMSDEDLSNFVRENLLLEMKGTEEVGWVKAKFLSKVPVTRKELKEIRESYKSDHAMDAIRYGVFLPSTPKKVELFGRIIAWISGLIKKKKK